MCCVEAMSSSYSSTAPAVKPVWNVHLVESWRDRGKPPWSSIRAARAAATPGSVILVVLGSQAAAGRDKDVEELRRKADLDEEDVVECFHSFQDGEKGDSVKGMFTGVAHGGGPGIEGKKVVVTNRALWVPRGTLVHSVQVLKLPLPEICGVFLDQLNRMANRKQAEAGEDGLRLSVNLHLSGSAQMAKFNAPLVKWMEKSWMSNRIPNALRVQIKKGGSNIGKPALGREAPWFRQQSQAQLQQQQQQQQQQQRQQQQQQQQPKYESAEHRKIENMRQKDHGAFRLAFPFETDLEVPPGFSFMEKALSHGEVREVVRVYNQLLSQGPPATIDPGVPPLVQSTQLKNSRMIQATMPAYIFARLFGVPEDLADDPRFAVGGYGSGGGGGGGVWGDSRGGREGGSDRGGGDMWGRPKYFHEERAEEGFGFLMSRDLHPPVPVDEREFAGKFDQGRVERRVERRSFERGEEFLGRPNQGWHFNDEGLQFEERRRHFETEQETGEFLARPREIFQESLPPPQEERERRRSFNDGGQLEPRWDHHETPQPPPQLQAPPPSRFQEDLSQEDLRSTMLSRQQQQHQFERETVGKSVFSPDRLQPLDSHLRRTGQELRITIEGGERRPTDIFGGSGSGGGGGGGGGGSGGGDGDGDGDDGSGDTKGDYTSREQEQPPAGAGAPAPPPLSWPQPASSASGPARTLTSHFYDIARRKGMGTAYGGDMMLAWRVCGHSEATLADLVSEACGAGGNKNQLRMALMREIYGIPADEIPKEVNVNEVVDETANYFMPGDVIVVSGGASTSSASSAQSMRKERREKEAFGSWKNSVTGRTVCHPDPGPSAFRRRSPPAKRRREPSPPWSRAPGPVPPPRSSLPAAPRLPPFEVAPTRPFVNDLLLDGGCASLEKAQFHWTPLVQFTTARLSARARVASHELPAVTAVVQRLMSHTKLSRPALEALRDAHGPEGVEMVVSESLEPFRSALQSMEGELTTEMVTRLVVDFISGRPP